MDNSPPSDSNPTANSQNTEQSSVTPSQRPVKVVQPLSPSLQTPSVQPVQPNVAPSVTLGNAPQVGDTTIQPATGDIATSQPPRANASSLYPDATRGINSAANSYQAPQPVNDQVSESIDDNKAKPIIIMVIALGALLAALNAYGFYITLRDHGNMFYLVLGAVEVLLSIGIVLRKEIARSTYVLIAILIFIFSLYSSYEYIKGISGLSNDRKAIIAQTQQQIAGFQNGPDPSEWAPQIQQDKTLEQQELRDLSLKNQLTPIVINYVITLVPIIFLTRQSVKKVFN